MPQKIITRPGFQSKAEPFFSARHAERKTFFQPKLRIGPSDDVYEKEADAVADRVLQTANSLPALHQAKIISPVQRACGEGDQDVSHEKKLQRSSFVPMIQPAKTPHGIQRAIKVDPAVDLDTMGFHVVRTGDTYTSNVVTKNSVWNEIISSLFFSPRTFQVKGSTSGEANRNFKAHLKARYDITTFASKRAYDFGAGANFKMNPEFWIVDLVNGTFDVKPGVNPQKAREDLIAHPEKYAIACEAASKITMLGGSKSDALRGDYGNADDEWIPGDWGWIKNLNHTGSAGREGENLIYVGQDLYWGHTADKIHYRTLEQWIEIVNSWNSGGAQLQGWRNYPGNGLV